MKSLKILKFLFAILVMAVGMAALGMPELFGTVGLILAAPLVLGSIETSDDARVERSKLLDKMTEMIQLRKAEKRAFTDDEQKEYDQLRDDAENLEKHIKQLADEEKRMYQKSEMEYNKRKASGKYSPQEKEQQQLRKFSFAKLVKAGMSGKAPEGLEAEMSQEARAEAVKSGINVGTYAIPDVALRAMSATGTTSEAGDQGGDLIPTEKSGLIQALEPRLTLAQMGAQMMGNIIGGNFEMPGMGAVTSAWEGEVDEAVDGSPGTTVKKLTPHRLATIAIYSRQLEFQADYNIEMVLRDLIYKSLAGKVEKTAINGGGSEEPDGILSTADIATVIGGATGLAPTHAHIVELETKVANLDADVGSLGYLTNSKVRGKLKTTLKAAGVPGYIWEFPNELNGYRALVSNYVPSNLEKSTSGEVLSAILFGNFSDLFMANWAGIDLVFDDVTLAGKAQKRLVANTWWDFAVLRKESFAKMIDAITA